MAKKERDIVKLIYEDNKEYERLKTWWLNERKKLGCRHPCSKRAVIEYNIPFSSFANAIIGYIEHLEEQSNKLNEINSQCLTQ